MTLSRKDSVSTVVFYVDTSFSDLGFQAKAIQESCSLVMSSTHNGSKASINQSALSSQNSPTQSASYLHSLNHPIGIVLTHELK